jgi:hypothetical protein
MSKSFPSLAKALPIMICLILVIASCNPKPASPSISSPNAATDTALPTFLPPTQTPTLSPTAAPVVNPADYLPTINDVPRVFEGPWATDEDTLDGNHSYMVGYLSSGQSNYQLWITISIAAQPWMEIPASLTSNLKPVEAAPVGQGSQALLDPNDSSAVDFLFFKDRALVNVQGHGFDMETVVNLGKLIESRLPEKLQDPPPIIFPEQLDQAAFAKYFNAVNVGTRKSGSNEITPAVVFSRQNNEHPCWNYDAIPGVPGYETPTYAIYDLQAHLYLLKWRSFSDTTGGCFPALQPGQYEFKLAVGNTLVAATIFEIK